MVLTLGETFIKWEVVGKKVNVSFATLNKGSSKIHSFKKNCIHF